MEDYEIQGQIEAERKRRERRAALRKKRERERRIRKIVMIALVVLLVAALSGAAFSLIRREGGDPDASRKASEKSSGETGESKTEEKTEPSETSSEAPASSEVPPSPTEMPETLPPEPTVPTSGAYTDPLNGLLADNGTFPDVLSLPNQSVPYGNDLDQKDELGRTAGVHYYESLYGKYHPVYYVNTTEPVLYLTFDEGYEAGYTPLILDTLKEKNVKAVFFITKQFFDSDPELVKRMIDEGHTVGNHTCRHPSGGYPRYVDANGLDSMVEDVQKLHKLVYDAFGYKMTLFRFPEGEASEQTMAKLYNLGYTSVFWGFAHYDYNQEKQPDPEETLARCLKSMAPGEVYLLHAVSSSNTAALPEFIDQARAAGYRFDLISAK